MVTWQVCHTPSLEKRKSEISRCAVDGDHFLREFCLLIDKPDSFHSIHSSASSNFTKHITQEHNVIFQDKKSKARAYKWANLMRYFNLNVFL